MNNKIPLKQFAEVYSKELNISQSEAEAFIKQVFATVSSELVAGNPVTVDGIGTFAISSTSTDPVEFIPDESLAAEINSPFAIFSPVVLEEGVTEEELAEVSEIPENSEISEESEKSEESEESEVSEASEISEISEESEESDETEAPEESEASEEEAEIPEEAEVAEIPVPAEEPVKEWEDEEEEYVVQPEIQHSKFGTGFVIGLIVGLAIGALVLCAYILYFVNANPSGDSVETELVETHISPVQ